MILLGAVLALLCGVAAASSWSPSVAITSPGPGKTVSGTISWQVSASNATRVEFAIDGVVKSTDSSWPYTFGRLGKLDTTTLSNGSHTLTATAYGRAGRSDSASVTVTVANSAPLDVAISAPADGATVSGSVPWQAAVTSGAAARVEFAIDGGGVSWTEYATPYLYHGDGNELDTTTLSNGTHHLAVTAVSASGQKASASVTVDVENSAVAPPPPPPPPPAPAPALPTATDAPAISGSVVAGDKLTATAGTWDNHPTSYSYQWKRCNAFGGACSSVAGETDPTYTTSPTDEGKTLRVAVTAANTTGSGSATSAPTDQVEAPPPPAPAPAPAPAPSPSPSPAPSPTPAPTDNTAWSTATAYTQNRPAFTTQRAVDVTSQSQLAAAIANLRPGDYVKATQPFSVTGQFEIMKSLSAPAVLDLTGVSFKGGGSGVYAAVFINASSNLRIYGGDLTNPYDEGILVSSATNVLWWGFTIHNTGGSGLAMLPNGGNINGNDFAGEISNWGGNLSLDPHAEKGTGIHGAILADTDGSWTFDNNRLALDEHDGPTGAGVEIGDNDGSSVTGNTLYLRAIHLSFKATQQVAGNALQLWGASRIGLTVPYLEASNLTGRAVEDDGVYSGTPMSGVVVKYGRASNVCLNSILSNVAWATHAGVVYQDIATS